MKHDAFLSFDTENDELRKWVTTTLVNGLEVNGYNIFLPDRDIMFGAIRALATIDTLQTTRNFVLILSESYLNQEDQIWTENEWKYGWHIFLKDPSKNIVLINYDHVSSFDVKHLQIKAFLRVGGQIEFLNHQRNILQQIQGKLGPKCSIEQHNNAKPIFTPVDLFLAKDDENGNTYDDDGINDLDDNLDYYKENTAEKCTDVKDCTAEYFSDNNGCRDIELGTELCCTDNIIDINTEHGNYVNATADQHIECINGTNHTYNNRLLTISKKGTIEISELGRPVQGVHKYWV